MANADALRAMLRLPSVSNMSNPDPYVAKRTAQIVSGEDEYAPADADLMIQQEGIARNTGMGFSRDQLRDAGMQHLRQQLALVEAPEQIKAQAGLAQTNLKGQYDVKAAQAAATAAEARAQANQDAIAARTQQQIDATNSRFDREQTLRETKDTRAAGQVPNTVLTTIGNQRKQLEAAIAKAEPGTLAKFIGRKNPRAAELATFDNALALAQRINAQSPDADAQTGAAAMGENALTPEELGQVQTFLLMLRGH